MVHLKEAKGKKESRKKKACFSIRNTCLLIQVAHLVNIIALQRNSAWREHFKGNLQVHTPHIYPQIRRQITFCPTESSNSGTLSKKIEKQKISSMKTKMHKNIHHLQKAEVDE